MKKLFGTDGIRGVANSFPIDAETALSVGKAVASHFRKTTSEASAHIVIGQDTRISGDMLAFAVAAGASAAGLDVYMLGVLPTPGIARMTVATGAVAGIVISASHNPFEDNGIKLFDAAGYKLPDAAEQSIEKLLHESANLPVAPSHKIGRVTQITDAVDQYVNFLLSRFDRQSLNGLKVVLDCANGATHQAAPALFERLDAKVITIFCEPDGVNINAGCGSQHPEALAEKVVANKADLGLAFDGDGDRLIAVDEIGQVLSGDQIMAVCAEDLKARDLLKKDLVVTTVMSNLGFGLAMKRLGIQWHATQVGDRYVMEKMLELGGVLGGEDSGHMIFHQLNTTGDGLIAGLQLIGVMKRKDKPLSVLKKVMTVFPQTLINVPVASKPDLSSIPEIKAAIERVTSELSDQGRVLVRYSGTQQMCRVMIEGPSEDITNGYCKEIADVIKQFIGT